MVEIKETQEVVIAKPVAIRPSLSNLKSLSELVSGGGASPTAPPKPAESAVTIIRPRTVRFKPVSSFHLASGVGIFPLLATFGPYLLVMPIVFDA